MSNFCNTVIFNSDSTTISRSRASRAISSRVSIVVLCSHHRDDNNDWRDKKRKSSENEWKKMNRKGKRKRKRGIWRGRKREENRKEEHNHTLINDIIICDSPVYKPKTTLLHIPFTSSHSKCCIAELLKGKVHTHFIDRSDIHASMNPPLTEVKQYIALNTVEICSGIIFDFCTKLSCQSDQQ